MNETEPRRRAPQPIKNGEPVQLIAVAGVPMIRPGDDLAALLAEALGASGHRLEDGDVVVIAQKIVSKAEGRFADLADVIPSHEAETLAAQTGKDPRLVELILREANEVVAATEQVLIVAHRLGFVLANAGIDQSNVSDGEDRVLLLPLDPDGSAARLREKLEAAYGVHIGVVINDSIGRAWRNGSIGMSLGASGLPALLDLRDRRDLNGRPLAVTEVGLADELASAASLLMGQANEGRPMVILRGLRLPAGNGRAADLIRPKHRDLFR